MYLRKLMLVMYKDPTNLNVMQDNRTFKFRYSTNRVETNQMLQGKELNPDIYRSTQNMLKTLILLKQGLAPLSESIFNLIYDAKHQLRESAVRQEVGSIVLDTVIYNIYK